MSLDIVILGRDGAPETQISIGTAQHECLMKIAKIHNLKTLFKLNNYFSDTSFGEHELAPLSNEIAVAATQLSRDQSTSSLLENFLNLIKLAQARKEALHVISD